MELGCIRGTRFQTQDFHLCFCSMAFQSDKPCAPLNGNVGIALCELQPFRLQRVGVKLPNSELHNALGLNEVSDIV